MQGRTQEAGRKQKSARNRVPAGPIFQQGDSAVTNALNRYRRLCCSSALAIASLNAVSPAFAQDTPAESEAESGPQDIVVTANRRDQSVQDIPATITAFGESEIRDLRIQEVADLPRLTPGLAFRVTGATMDPQFTVRGIGMNNSETNQNPAVTVYLDEIALPSHAMLGFQLFDMERIEVLKGPQGTLYGRNTTGGAINLVSKRPTKELSFDGRIDAGSLNLREIEAGISGPLSDTLSARVALNSYERHGWQTLILGPRHGDVDSRNGDISRQAIRGSLLWEPSSNFDALLIADYGRSRSEALAYEHTGNLKKDGSRALCAYPTTGVRDEANCGSYAIPRTGVGGTATGGTVIFSDLGTDPRESYASFIYGNDNDVDSGGVSLKMNLGLGRTTLTSVTGYRKFKRISGSDDGSPYLLSDNGRRQKLGLFQQEVRLSSDESWGPVSWIVGGYYTRDTNDDFVLFDQSDQFAYSAEFTSQYRQVTKSAAVFAQADWEIVPSLTLTGGARYTEEDKSFFYDGFTVGTGAFPNPARNYSNKIDANKATWRVALKYEATRDLDFYASVSTGFKGGGFPGTIAFSVGQLTPFAPETITSYEAGVKTALFDRTLRLNAAVYYYDWKDFQATTQVNVAGIPLVILGTAGDAEITGAEADITWYPVPSLMLKTGINYMDAEIQNGRYAGQVPPNAPDLMINGIARWEAEAPLGILTPFIQGDFSYNSATYVALANGPTVEEPKLFLANARAGVKLDNGVEIAAWVKNLTDKLYRTQVLGSGSASLPARSTYGDPRTWGVSLAYRF